MDNGPSVIKDDSIYELYDNIALSLLDFAYLCCNKFPQTLEGARKHGDVAPLVAQFKELVKNALNNIVASKFQRDNLEEASSHGLRYSENDLLVIEKKKLSEDEIIFYSDPIDYCILKNLMGEPFEHEVTRIDGDVVFPPKKLEAKLNELLSVPMFWKDDILELEKDIPWLANSPFLHPGLRNIPTKKNAQGVKANDGGAVVSGGTQTKRESGKTATKEKHAKWQNKADELHKEAPELSKKEIVDLIFKDKELNPKHRDRATILRNIKLL